MLENEKKVAELNEDELSNIAGGYRRPEYSGTPSGAFRPMTCPECGKSFTVHVKALSGASCPECGCKV